MHTRLEMYKFCHRNSLRYARGQDLWMEAFEWG